VIKIYLPPVVYFLLSVPIPDKEVKKMKTRYSLKAIIWWLMFCLALPMPLMAQVAEDSATIQQPQTYSQEELDRLLAPIALYPDTLLSQVLMASTYPRKIIMPFSTSARLDE
jgi:hypothetical protein